MYSSAFSVEMNKTEGLQDLADCYFSVDLKQHNSLHGFPSGTIR